MLTHTEDSIYHFLTTDISTYELDEAPKHRAAFIYKLKVEEEVESGEEEQVELVYGDSSLQESSGDSSKKKGKKGKGKKTKGKGGSRGKSPSDRSKTKKKKKKGGKKAITDESAGETSKSDSSKSKSSKNSSESKFKSVFINNCGIVLAGFGYHTVFSIHTTDRPFKLFHYVV